MVFCEDDRFFSLDSCRQVDKACQLDQAFESRIRACS